MRPALQLWLVAAAATPLCKATCPCANATLCQPIQREGGERVFAFHTAGNSSWRDYDWSLLSTVCVFGEVDPQLLCHAHSVGARVTLGVGGLDRSEWQNQTAVSSWVQGVVKQVSATYADGINIDIEQGATDPADVAALTVLSRAAAEAIRAVNPHAQVTFDVPSEGLSQEGCGQQYGRDYDYKGLAEALDFLVVMDYDSNSAHSAVGRNQHFLPTDSPVYRYANRSAAEAACAAAGYPRLCTKAELYGFSNCAKGWCSDWEGYWMAETAPGCGKAGFNEGTGVAGAYCCSTETVPCPTCFFSNAALPVVQAGVDCFASLGVPADRLVLAYPWYGYDYTCALNPDGSKITNLNTCVVTAANQVGYPRVQQLLAEGAVAQWLDNASTPYLGYSTPTGEVHRVDYDDSRSLQLKYELAAKVGARGIGMWTANSLNYSDPQSVAQFWADLKLFPGRAAGPRQH